MQTSEAKPTAVQLPIAEHSGRVHRIASGVDSYGQGFQPVFDTWLKAMGLKFDPFAVLDAGQDPDIPTYLVGHADFEQLWGDWPAFAFAPAGGGKTTFRVRLARACRIGEDGRRVFPIVYHRLPAPDEIAHDDSDVHLKPIIRQFAQELLFLLAYRPVELHRLDEASLVNVRRVLDANLPSPLDDYLTRLRDRGDLSPLTHEFDRTASYLVNPPGPQDLQRVCDRLARVPASPATDLSPAQRFDELTHLILGPLRFEAIYLLIDGVDAYQETNDDPTTALRVLRWLLDNTSAWTARRIFTKFFLPAELESVLRRQMPHLLTSPAKVAIIEWTADALAEVIRNRVSVASEGMFDSLDAISNPGLHDVEEKLVHQVRVRVPREVLVLTERLLVEHVQRAQARDKLDPQDLESAFAWYAGQAATARSL